MYKCVYMYLRIRYLNECMYLVYTIVRQKLDNIFDRDKTVQVL